MNRWQRPKADPEISLAPLVDVVLLLLIFFMVSTTFDQKTQIKVELPEAGAEPAADESEVVELLIDAQGRYYLDGKRLEGTDAEALSQALSQMPKDADTPLTIIADGQTPHQSVVRAMDVAGRLGYEKLSISARSVPPP
jgi:biopolymer transport protein ExbD